MRAMPMKGFSANDESKAVTEASHDLRDLATPRERLLTGRFSFSFAAEIAVVAGVEKLLDIAHEMSFAVART